MSCKEYLDDLKKLVDDNPGVEIPLPGQFTDADLDSLWFEPASKQ